MSPEDFPQFPDPRVREVMACAANLAETVSMHINVSDGVHDATDALKTALFAAQHSKARTHEHPVEFDKWGFGKPVTNRFDVDGSKPGGKAFIAAIEEKPCPGCGKEGVFHSDGECCR